MFAPATRLSPDTDSQARESSRLLQDLLHRLGQAVADQAVGPAAPEVVTFPVAGDPVLLGLPGLVLLRAADRPVERLVQGVLSLLERFAFQFGSTLGGDPFPEPLPTPISPTTLGSRARPNSSSKSWTIIAQSPG